MCVLLRHIHIRQFPRRLRPGTQPYAMAIYMPLDFTRFPRIALEFSVTLEQQLKKWSVVRPSSDSQQMYSTQIQNVGSVGPFIFTAHCNIFSIDAAHTIKVTCWHASMTFGFTHTKHSWFSFRTLWSPSALRPSKTLQPHCFATSSSCITLWLVAATSSPPSICGELMTCNWCNYIDKHLHFSCNYYASGRSQKTT